MCIYLLVTLVKVLAGDIIQALQQRPGSWVSWAEVKNRSPEGKFPSLAWGYIQLCDSEAGAGGDCRGSAMVRALVHHPGYVGSWL